MNHLASLAALGLVGLGCARAQVTIGAPAPEFSIDKFYNDAPKAFAGMKGKAVMVEFFATW